MPLSCYPDSTGLSERGCFYSPNTFQIFISLTRYVTIMLTAFCLAKSHLVMTQIFATLEVTGYDLAQVSSSLVQWQKLSCKIKTESFSRRQEFKLVNVYEILLIFHRNTSSPNNVKPPKKFGKQAAKKQVIYHQSPTADKFLARTCPDLFTKVTQNALAVDWKKLFLSKHVHSFFHLASADRL